MRTCKDTKITETYNFKPFHDSVHVWSSLEQIKNSVILRYIVPLRHMIVVDCCVDAISFPVCAVM